MTIETEAAALATGVNVLTNTLDLPLTNLTSQVTAASGFVPDAESARDTANTHKTDAETAQATTVTQEGIASTAAAGAYQDLVAIAQTKTETAVDVFVYDTSKDSDGGAWRNRTQHTSWYNETLNTSTRGSRKEFPAVAVIVAQNTKLTIYDGDDPSMPMWMLIKKDGLASNLFGTHPNMERIISDISALNGVLVVGSYMPGFTIEAHSTSYGLATISFGADSAHIYRGHRLQKYSGTLEQRHDNSGYATITSAINIKSSWVHKVAMKVLPGAPISPITGLSVPTIAVGTSKGVSIIKHDGSVVDITNNDGVNYAQTVFFTKDNKIACQLYSQIRGLRIFDIPESDLIQSNHYTKGYALEWYEGFTEVTGEQVGDLKVLATSLGNTPNNIEFAIPVAEISGSFSMGSTLGITNIVRNSITPIKGLFNYTTADYNTGWITRETELAALMSIDDTNITGTQFLANNTFANNANAKQYLISTKGWVITDGGEA